MKQKLLFLFLFLCFVNFSFSQQEITGKVIDSLGAVSNAHIVNLSDMIGTVTNNSGEFTLTVAENDVLELSSIQHGKKFIAVTKNFLEQENIVITLTIKTYELEEVVVKKNKMSGFLSLDSKKVPKDTIGEIVNKVVQDIMNIDYSKPFIEKYDKINRKNRPPVVVVDPVEKVLGQGLFFSMSKNLAKGKKEIELYGLKQKLEFSKEFPKVILATLGEDFFFKDLKIRKEDYNNFIMYCSFRKVEELYKKNKILELIRIFREESIAYQKIKKGNEN